MSAPILELKDVHKTFFIGFFRKRIEALRGVSLEVHEGEAFGFVGPNGAGKTTSIKCALQLIHPSRGEIRIFGEPPSSPAARARVGYLPENPYIYSYLKPLEFLHLCGQLCNMSRADADRRARQLLDRLSLGHALDRPVGKFSKGMMQRLGMCQALLHEPELLILDEPFSGLDPIGRKDIRDILDEQHKQGRTLMLTSHVLSDVEMICDRVAIVNLGKVTAYGKLDDLLKADVRRVEIEVAGTDEDLRAAVDEHALEVRTLRESTIVVVEGDEASTKVMSLAMERGAVIHSVTPHRETLEDLFVRNALASGADDR